MDVFSNIHLLSSLFIFSYTFRNNLFLYINHSIKNIIRLLHAVSNTGYHPSRYWAVP